MSFKDNSDVEKFSKGTHGEPKGGSSVESAIGRERAWEYLLRRKAEGITDRILKANERSMNYPAESYIPLCSTDVEETERSREPYKRDIRWFPPTQYVSHPESGFPIEASVSSGSAHCSGLAPVPNEGFFLDRTGSKQDQRNILSGHAVYDKHSSSGTQTHNNYYQRKEFMMASLQIRSVQFNEQGLHSNVNHAKHTSAEQRAEEPFNLELPSHQNLMPRDHVSNNKDMIKGGPTPVEDLCQNTENPQDSSMKTTRGCFSGSHLSGPLLAHGTSKPAENVSFAPSKQIPVMNSGKRHLTLIHLLPYPAEGVEVVYTTDPIEVEAWLRNNVIDCSVQSVGLDIEWKPQFKSKKNGGVENKTAVLQLAVESSSLVFQLYNLRRPLNVLVSVLKDERILKVGSGILQDVTKLKKDTGLECIGLVDTQNMAKDLGMLEIKRGLKSLAKHLLGIELEKPKLVTMSNWENCPLTVKQIHYAALDAWVGLKIYQSMKAMQGKSTCKSFEGSNLVNCEEAKKNENPPLCHVCGKKVKSSSALSEHLKVHRKCQCGQYFVGKISKKHKKKCPWLNSFCCHVCGEQNETSSALSEHMKIHPKCQCGQYFVAKISKEHRRECSKLNQWAESILKHIKINSDEPGLCSACGKKCKTLENLISHIRKAGHVLCPFCTDLLPCGASYSHILKCQDLTNE